MRSERACEVPSDAESVSIVRDPADLVAHERAVGWGVEQLREALVGRGIFVRERERLDADREFGTVIDEPCILITGHESAAATGVLRRAGVRIPQTPEALGLVPGSLGERSVLLACGTDGRGLAYAVLELADGVVQAEDPLAALSVPAPLVERPANAVRSVARLFTSEVNDKPWFYDRQFWRRYLSELMTHRFNRFSRMGLAHLA